MAKEEITITLDATRLIKQMKTMHFEFMACVSDVIVGQDVESQLNELGISTDNGNEPI